MDFSDEDACRRVIGEQRDQLMQLRAQLKQHTQRPLTLVPDIQRVAEDKPWMTGRTIGLKIPDTLRERLTVQQEIRGLKSYRQVVSSCIELGLRVMEGSPHVKEAVEMAESEERPYPPPAVGCHNMLSA